MIPPELDLDAVTDVLIGQGLSTRTVVVYLSALRRVHALCVERGWDMATLSPTQAREISDRWPGTRSSRSQLRSVLQRYWESAGRLDGPVRAIRVPPQPRTVCRALGEPEAAILAAHAEARGDSRGLVVLLGLYTGLRRSEIASLRWDDVDAEGWATINGKGDVVRTIPIHPIALGHFRAEESRRRRHSPYVFPGRANVGPMNPTTVWLWCREVALAAGLGEVATHVLRHTALATANDATGDLRAVQALAGHARPETTAGYTRATRRRLAAVVGAIDYGGTQ